MTKSLSTIVLSSSDPMILAASKMQASWQSRRIWHNCCRFFMHIYLCKHWMKEFSDSFEPKRPSVLLNKVGWLSKLVGFLDEIVARCLTVKPRQWSWRYPCPPSRQGGLIILRLLRGFSTTLALRVQAWIVNTKRTRLNGPPFVWIKNAHALHRNEREMTTDNMATRNHNIIAHVKPWTIFKIGLPSKPLTLYQIKTWYLS